MYAGNVESNELELPLRCTEVEIFLCQTDEAPPRRGKKHRFKTIAEDLDDVSTSHLNNEDLIFQKSF